MRNSLLTDCNELRDTLTEVERSRIEIKTTLNNKQFDLVSLEKKFESKDKQLNDLRKELSSQLNKGKTMQESLDVAR